MSLTRPLLKKYGKLIEKHGKDPTFSNSFYFVYSGHNYAQLRVILRSNFSKSFAPETFYQHVKNRLEAQDPLYLDFHNWVTHVRLFGYEVEGWP